MTTDRERVDRAKLRARMDRLTDRTPTMQGKSVDYYLERVVALAGGRGKRLDVNQLPEEDARELWLLTEELARSQGLM